MAFQISLLFLFKHKITLFYLLSFVFIRFITPCNSLLLTLIFLLLAVICSFVFTCSTTRCHSLYRSLSFIVPLVVIRYHSLSFDVTGCTTRLSFYTRSLFYNFLLFTSFVIKAKTKIYLV